MARESSARPQKCLMNSPGHKLLWALAGLLFLVAARGVRDPKNPRNPNRMLPAVALALAGMICFILSIFH